MRSRRAGSSTGWSATRSARCCRARSAAACRPVASSRSRSAWSSNASARSPRSPPASTGRSRRSSRPTAERARSRPRSCASTARRSTSRDEATAERHRAAIAGAPPDRRPRSARGRRSGRPAPPFTTSTLQQEASRRLGFSPKRTMSVAQRLYEGVETGDGQVGLITYMRTDSTAIAGVAMGEAREVIDERYGADLHDAQGPRLQDQVEGRPGGARVDPADELPARPGFGRGHRSSPTSCASTG